MKEFFKSYWELNKTNWRWMKKHWVGYTILMVVVLFIEFIVLGFYYGLIELPKSLFGLDERDCELETEEA